MQPRDAAAQRILDLRGMRVILDSDLARLYGVTPKRFNEQVRRNAKRFPPGFVFRLTNQELAILRSQFATSSWGGRRYPPLAFTEHGAVMAATILNSPAAIEASVFVVRAFVQLREDLKAHEEIARRLAQLERKVGSHDRAILEILQALRALTQPAEAPRRRRIGFVQD
ncbi:MAG TPA: ORF6N domain-containing protein [Burkholderiales bacterium]|nr:ORF6N domain-containing protein [Burkholderiales bacterium]